MKASMHLNLSQHLTLTPQLQQAIRLLQLSTLDLTQELQDAAESNPMLELIEAERKSEPAEPFPESVNREEMPIEYYATKPSQGNSSSSMEAPNLENLHATSENLTDHLLWQVQMGRFSETDKAIAEAIIDAINDDGLLTLSLEDIQHTVPRTTSDDPIELDEVHAVLSRIQRFDPVGCGARSLEECLLLQLLQLPEDTPGMEHAKRVVQNYLKELAQHNYNVILKETKLKAEQLQDAVNLIQTLHPKPGSLIDAGNAEYVIPDVVVNKGEKNWQVSLNPEAVPKVKINQGYAGLIQRADKSADNVFLKNNLQEAKWLIKSVQSRHDTLLRVAKCIVNHQKDFLEHGEEAMKPLVLHDIASALDLHESTVSRVTTQKYMLTPRGVFELKYFFCSHVSTDSGGECSSTAIRAVIKKLIAAENTKKPLSDNKIAQTLGKQGIKVARRTVAKYRESMNIPPSNERKAITQ